MIAETVGKFKQLEYHDEETGKTMPYNLFVPEDYDESKSYPMIMFIGDASTVSPDVTVPLTQGYGGIIGPRRRSRPSTRASCSCRNTAP